MGDISKHSPGRTQLTWYLHIRFTHLYMLYRKIHLGDENIICQSKEANDTRGNYKHQIQDSGDLQAGRVFWRLRL